LAAPPAMAAAPGGVGVAAVCNPSHVGTATGGSFLYEGVNIRTGPGTNCTSVGLGYSSHSVTYYCYRVGDPVTFNGATYYTWTYLRDNTTGVFGWSSDAFLGGLGSWTPCG